MKLRLLSLLIIAGILLTHFHVTMAQPPCLTPMRLSAGVQARVTPGLPNLIRTQPTLGASSLIVGQIPAGDGFFVIGGPVCSNSMNWWEINYNGLVGWTPESSAAGEYWLEPLWCSLVQPRLTPGLQGRVTPGLPNMLRALPERGSASTIIAEIPGGAMFSTVSGPLCSEGMNWWQVNYNGLIGWTPENSSSGEYWLEPYNVPVPVCSSALPAHMLIGLTGYVLYGPSNNLRAQPSLNASILGEMPGGATFNVLTGPVCVDGLNWWQINFNGLIGWTAEGQNGEYWIEPFQCSSALPSRLVLGMRGRITPGIPNRLRAQPSLNADTLSLIPEGATFAIIAGPTCADNAIWWRVIYNGTVGWTMEGQNNQYWVDPTY